MTILYYITTELMFACVNISLARACNNYRIIEGITGQKTTNKHEIVEEQIVNCNVVSSCYRQLFRSFYHKLSLYTEKKSKYSSKKIRKRMKNDSCDLESDIVF